jgi:hypothetical protein
MGICGVYKDFATVTYNKDNTAKNIPKGLYTCYDKSLITWRKSK